MTHIFEDLTLRTPLLQDQQAAPVLGNLNGLDVDQLQQDELPIDIADHLADLRLEDLEGNFNAEVHQIPLNEDQFHFSTDLFDAIATMGKNLLRGRNPFLPFSSTQNIIKNIAFVLSFIGILALTVGVIIGSLFPPVLMVGSCLTGFVVLMATVHGFLYRRRNQTLPEPTQWADLEVQDSYRGA